MADYTLSYESSLDASDFLSSIRYMISGLDDVRGAADDTRSAFDQLGDINLGSAISSLDGLGSAAKDVGGAAQEAKSSFDLLDAIELGAVMVAVQGLIGLMEDLTNTIEGSVRGFADLEDAATRASMMGGGGNAQQYMAQSGTLAMKYGMPVTQIAPMLGMTSAYSATMGQNINPDLAVAIAKVTGMNPNEAASALGSAMTSTSVTGTQYSDKALADMLTKSFMMTGGKMAPSDFTTVLAKLMPMASQFGGIPGTLGMMDIVSMVGLPGGARGGLLQVESFGKQLEAIHEETKTTKKGTTTSLKGSESLIGAFEAAGLDPLLEKQKGAIQSVVDLYTKGGAEAFKTLGPIGGVLLQIAAHTDEWHAATQKVTDSVGEVDKDVNTLNEDSSTSLARIEEGTKHVGEEFGSLFKGPLKDAANFITGPFVESFDKVVEKLKSGDVKGAFKEAFNLETIGLDFITKGLNTVKESILGYDWVNIGKDVSGMLGTEMSYIKLDARELGKDVAAGVMAAFDFARGALGDQNIWKVLTGDTPLSDFLGPIGMVVGAEFKVMTATIKLEMDKASVGSIQAMYDFHDKGVDAITGVLAAVIGLAGYIEGDLVSAMTKAGEAWDKLKHGDVGGAVGTITSGGSNTQTPISNLWTNGSDTYTLGDLRDEWGISSSEEAMKAGFRPVTVTSGINLESSKRQTQEMTPQQQAALTPSAMATAYISHGAMIDVPGKGRSGSSGVDYLKDYVNNLLFPKDTWTPETLAQEPPGKKYFGIIPKIFQQGGYITQGERSIAGYFGGNRQTSLGMGTEPNAMTSEVGGGMVALPGLPGPSSTPMISATDIKNMADNTKETASSTKDLIEIAKLNPPEAAKNILAGFGITKLGTFDPKDMLDADQRNLDAANANLADVKKILGETHNIESDTNTKIKSMMPNAGGSTTGANGLTPMQQIALGGTRTPGMFYGEGVHGPQINGFLTPEGGYAGPTEYYPQYRNQVNMGIEAANVAMSSIIQPGGFGLAGKAGTGTVGGLSQANVKVGIDLTEAKTTLTTYIDQIKQMHPEMHVKITPDVDAGALVQLVQQAVARELARRGL